MHIQGDHLREMDVVDEGGESGGIVEEVIHMKKMLFKLNSNKRKHGTDFFSKLSKVCCHSSSVL